jgi:energy-coupling factor transporter transmembrane protein EcfT
LTGKAGRQELAEQVSSLVALTVPAIVLTTKRAWMMTEAAAVRGFDSPHRRPYQRLAMSRLDGVLLAASAAVTVALILW